MTEYTFEENLERDVTVFGACMAAVTSGGGSDMDAAMAVCMQMEEFREGPDKVLAYSRWMSAPERMAHRARVATEYMRRAKFRMPGEEKRI